MQQKSSGNSQSEGSTHCRSYLSSTAFEKLPQIQSFKEEPEAV